MTDETDTTSAIPTLEDWQHWTWSWAGPSR